MRPSISLGLSRSLLCLAVLCLAPACSLSDSPQEPSAGLAGPGGASFVVWGPAGASEPGDPNNPWLDGTALDGGDPGSLGSNDPAFGTGGSGASGPGTSKDTDHDSVSSADGAREDERLEPTELRLRAYVESTSADKLLLVEHVGGGPSLNCAVHIYSNGSTDVWRRLAVPDGLGLGERALLCVPDAVVPACQATFGGSAFNGDDALSITCGDRIVDLFGVIGEDPGTAWKGEGADGASLKTADSGLWRCQVRKERPFALSDWVAWPWQEDASFSGPTCPAVGLGGATSE